MVWPGASLPEGVSHRPLLLHPLERRRKLLVLHVGQAERLARDRLLKHERLERLRNGRGPDHLVLDAVPQFAQVHIEGHPSQDVGNAGLGADISDRVAHPQVSAHRPVERAVEHAKDVSRGAADIDADDVDGLAPSDGLQYVADRPRRWA